MTCLGIEPLFHNHTYYYRYWCVLWALAPFGSTGMAPCGRGSLPVSALSSSREVDQAESHGTPAPLLPTLACKAACSHSQHTSSRYKCVSGLQDHTQADKIAKIQKDLDETKVRRGSQPCCSSI